MKHLVLCFLACCFLTAASAQVNTFPFFSGFEGTDGTLHENYPDGWTSEDLNTNDLGNQAWQIIKNSLLGDNARTDSSAIHMFSNFQEAHDDWLYTPGIEMEADATYTISFWYRNIQFLTSTEKLEVFVSTDAASTAIATAPKWEDDNIEDGQWTQGTLDYNPGNAGTYYFAFHAFSDAIQNILLIDDVTITETPEPVAVANREALERITCYPNPASTTLQFSGLGLQTVNATLFNIAGQQVHQTQLGSGNGQIDVARLPAGLYNLQLMQPSGAIAWRKVMVQH